MKSWWGLAPPSLQRRGAFFLKRQQHTFLKITEARTGRELELLRSHPKDERGSVREIGLCSTVDATPPFLELSPTVWPLLTSCSKWSFSGRLGGPEMDPFGDHGPWAGGHNVTFQGNKNSIPTNTYIRPSPLGGQRTSFGRAMPVAHANDT